MSVYLIHAPAVDMIKIGYAANPARRIGSIATSCPFPLAILATREGGFSLERAMHRALRESRVHGEWFRHWGQCVAWFHDFDYADCPGERSHADIIAAADCQRLAELRGTSIHTVRSWGQRNSIPSEHWPDIADAGFATLDELVAGITPRKRRKCEAGDA